MNNENTVTLKEAFHIMQEKKFMWKGEVIKTPRAIRSLREKGILNVTKTGEKNGHQTYIIDRDYLYHFIERWNLGLINHPYNPLYKKKR